MYSSPFDHVYQMIAQLRDSAQDADIKVARRLGDKIVELEEALDLVERWAEAASDRIDRIERNIEVLQSLCLEQGECLITVMAAIKETVR